MEFIVTDKQGKEQMTIKDADIDIECGGSNDFELKFSDVDFDKNVFTYGAHIVSVDSEFGGIIRNRKTSTSESEISVSGPTWRGLLTKKIISPDTGQDYKVVSGDIATIVKQIINPLFDGVIIASEEKTGVTVNSYQIDRYCTVYDGIMKMLESVGYKLVIKYKQRQRGESGYIEVSAFPIVDYSKQLEFSQDSSVDFTTEEEQGNVNHMIALGKGELKDRIVEHLYLQEDGSIGKNQYYFGVDEVTEVYDSSNSERQELVENATKKMLESANFKKVDVKADELEFMAEIGDLVGGRDYMTGFYAVRPIERKIYKLSNTDETIEYALKGGE